MNTCWAIGYDIIALYGAAVALFGGVGGRPSPENFWDALHFAWKHRKKYQNKYEYFFPQKGIILGNLFSAPPWY